MEAHAGVLDKGGNPYILHPLRVMMSLRTEEEKIVGVLHDVVEDCAELGYDWAYLESNGFSKTILDALRTVTKTPEEEKQNEELEEAGKLLAYLNFVKRAKSNPIEARVKRADIHDNLDVARIGELKQKDLDRLNRYKKALELLES